MALTKDMTWRGVPITGAYIRVDHVRGGKRENRPTPQHDGEAIWQAHVGIYADQNQPVPVLTVDVIVPFLPDESPFPAIYAALKASADFAGAVDC